MQRIIAFILALLCSTVSVSTAAAPLFTLDLDVSRPMEMPFAMERFSFDSFEDLIDDLDEEELRTTFAGYEVDRDIVDARIDFRGLQAELNFQPAAVAGEEVLVFKVLAGEEQILFETFRGSSHDQLVDKLEAFLKSQGGKTLNKLQAALIAHSPVDPIAGNPGSLANNQLSGQYQEGFSDQVSRIAPERERSAPEPERSSESSGPETENHALLGLRFGRYTAGDRTSNVFTLPLGYSFRLKEGGRGLRQATIAFPITYAEVEGGRAYAASIGGSMSWGMTERWSLSPPPSA